LIDSLDEEEFWSYNGSLTTPPCTEGVKWTVMRKVQPISQKQFEDLTALADNNRELQPINSRTLYQTWDNSEDEAMF